MHCRKKNIYGGKIIQTVYNWFHLPSHARHQYNKWHMRVVIERVEILNVNRDGALPLRSTPGYCLAHLTLRGQPHLTSAPTTRHYYANGN